jgi:hypothetical protein
MTCRATEGKWINLSSVTEVKAVALRIEVEGYAMPEDGPEGESIRTVGARFVH